MPARPVRVIPAAPVELIARLFTHADELLIERINFRRGGCWILDGYRDRDGYTEARGDKGHRTLYKLLVGAIPEDRVLDHLCRVRDCVNPAHLEPVTAGENTRRGGNTWKTHCVHGHEFTPENTYVWRKHRGCKECRRANVRKNRARAA